MTDRHDEHSIAEPELAKLVATVRRYSELESPTGDAAALARLADVLDADARAAGLRTERDPHATGDHLVWTLPARDAPGTLLLLSHYDTVWPIGTLAHMPVADAIVGGRAGLRGPGVYDTKAGLAILLDAIARVDASGAAHPEVRVLVIADEEIGSPTAGALVRREAERAFAVLGFEPPHPGGGLKTARRGSTRLRIGVRGIEAHAGLDLAAGVNAIDELVDQLISARALAADYPVLYNVGAISGGGRANVVAGEASAVIGIRFADADSERELLGALARLSPVRERAELSVEVLSQRPTWTPGAASDALAERCVAIASPLGVALQSGPANGAADTNTTGALGVPSVDGLGPDGGGAHAAHEWVSIESIAERALLLPELLRQLGPVA